MVGIGQRASTLSQNSGGKGAGGGSNSRPTSKDGAKKNIWSSMLDEVASGKRLPEKNLLVLGPFYLLFFLDFPLLFPRCGSLSIVTGMGGEWEDRLNNGE